MSAPATPAGGEHIAAGSGMTLPVFRVARSKRMHLYVLIVSVSTIAVLASVPAWAQRGTTSTMVTLFTLIALAQMWNLLGGYAGLISVGQQGFMGIGAYWLWYLADDLNVHPFVAVVGAAALAALVALPIAPLLFRLRGGYFAIGTWVFAEIMRIIVSNIEATGGGSGTTIMSAASIPFETRIPATYWIGLAVAVGSVLIVYFMLRSKLGLGLTAIRDNDLAAQSSGVNVFRSKLIVFVVAAFGCGAVGSVVALNLLFIQPAASFSINWTAFAIFMVVIGGFGSIEGPLIGAVIFFALQQTLNQYGSTYMLLLGAIAVVMATIAPRGIWGWVVQRWDLHLFPVRRGLVIESSPKTAEPAPSEPVVASSEPA